MEKIYTFNIQKEMNKYVCGEQTLQDVYDNTDNFIKTYLNILDDKKLLSFTVEDFQNPRVIYMAIREWMLDAGEDFFDYHNYDGVRFIYYLLSMGEITEELAAKIMFQDCGKNYRSYQLTIPDALSVLSYLDEHVKEEYAYDTLWQKVYQCFADYVAEFDSVNIYNRIHDELNDPRAMLFTKESIGEYTVEYDKLSQMKIMEMIKDVNEN